jgi:hypothetical protein
MRAVFIFAVLLLILSIPSPSLADASSSYNTLGIGTASCGTWVSARENTQDPQVSYMAESWIEGFLSAAAPVSLGRIQPLDGMDSDGIFVWIDNFCQENPIKYLSDAVTAFIVAHPR